MIESEKAAAIAVVVGLVAFAVRAKAAPVDTRRDTSSFDPIEPVGPIGYTGDAPLIPQPGDVTNVDADPVPASVVRFCQCAPLRSFGPACAGVTWLDIPFTGKVDFRDRLPVDCGRNV